MSRDAWAPSRRWIPNDDGLGVVGGITEDLMLRRREPRRAGMGAPASAAEVFLRQLAGLDHGLPAPDRAFLRRLHDRVRRRALPAAFGPELEDAVHRRSEVLERAELPTLAALRAEEPAVLAWSAAFPDLLPAPFRVGASARDHGRAVALAAARLARLAGRPVVDAFLAGLLHDIGRPFLDGLAATLEAPQRPRSSTLGQISDGLHATLGAVLTEHWGLPVEVQLIIEHHHQPGPAVPPAARRSVRVVRAADLFARLLLHDQPEPEPGAAARELEGHLRDLALEPDLELLDALASELAAWRALDTDDLPAP